MPMESEIVNSSTDALSYIDGNARMGHRGGMACKRFPYRRD